MAELTPDQWLAAEHLVRSRVLVAGPDPAGRQTVELAHQALIDLWPRLRAWLDDDRDFRTWHERVERQRADWAASGGDPGRLLRGTTLLRAEDWLVERGADVSGPNRDFIWAGRARSRRERWLRRVVRAVVAAAAIGAITLAGLFALQRGEARQQEAAAESRVLAAGSADLAQTEPARSLELALAAYRTQANPETEQVLFSRYLDRRETTPDDGEWRMTPNGSHIVRVVDDGSRLETAPVDDLSRTTASVARRGSQFQNPSTMCLCMDGTLLADRLTDGTIEVRTLPDLALVGTVGGPEVLHSETSAEIGLRNGLLVVTNGPRAQWWDPVAGTLVDEVDLVVLGAVDPGDDAWIVDHPDPALTAAFSPQSGALTVIDRSTGEPVERIEVSADALVLRIYAEGDHVGVFRRGSVPELWRTGDGVRTLGPLPSVAPRCAAGQEGVHRCSPPRYGFVWNFLDEPGLVLFGDRGRLTWHDPDTGDTLRVLDLGSRQPISASADGATVLHWEPVGGFGVARLSPDHWLACADPAEDAGDTAAERTC